MTANTAAKLATAAALIAAAALPAMAQDARRQLEAHAHGQGRLGVAIDGSRVEIELEAPASDIVGFEHAPANAKQRKAIADAKAVLARADNVVRLSPEAGCKLISAKVEVIGAAAGKPDAHGHKGHGHAHADAKPQANGAATPAEAQHSEVHATYALDCQAPGNIRTLAFEYFKRFKAAAKLDVTVIGPKGQARVEASREKPVVDLAGVS
ncbi:MAG: DUF2796 domain-containing protein [Hyphomicrobiaceae bacterium]|nr:DUF2796 domain-containing protein [Hyphomicrobiaceae bacterium]